jgi:hypothetical protein
MNSYFFKMTQAEKNNILDQHKTVYDGYATQYGQNNQQPLYVQDLANDKGGITVNNRGDVKSYTNMNINEMYYSVDAETAPEVSFDFGGPDSMAVNMEEQMDMIGDGSDDLDHGTFEDDEMEMLVSPEGDVELFMDDEDMESELDEPNFDEIDLTKSDDMDDDMFEPLQEQVNRTLNMFKRINKY